MFKLPRCGGLYVPHHVRRPLTLYIDDTSRDSNTVLRGTPISFAINQANPLVDKFKETKHTSSLLIYCYIYFSIRASIISGEELTKSDMEERKGRREKEADEL